MPCKPFRDFNSIDFLFTGFNLLGVLVKRVGKPFRKENLSHTVGDRQRVVRHTQKATRKLRHARQALGRPDTGSEGFFMIYPRDITTEAEAAVLEHADCLAAVIGKHWHPTDDTARDDVMLLVADLLRAHAETGIEMQTWRAALDVVLDHLAAEPEGADLLHRLGRPAWFTVIGATKDGQREPVAVLPGRRRLEVAIGVWTAQVQAPTAADAVRAASRVARPSA